ncbi:hypothetical protein CBR_g7957 [Chara braunii]|uniref:Ubiquitin-like domain-containing protein n=1 Tax=Chara braunii TaxID=69332 RepID=A0A388KKT7_CHABU|nr:hypothetical protein CBR_g7957 [Chara braunii]|eukprot:GBG70656.1 hypothetical protein CBR_g7957 [Chara braunii]
MTSRHVVLKFGASNFALDVFPEEGVEIFKFQVFSLTGVPPEEQKLFGLTVTPLPDDADLRSLLIADGQEVILVDRSGEDGNAIEKAVDGSAQNQAPTRSAGHSGTAVSQSVSQYELLAKQLQDEKDAAALVAAAAAAAAKEMLHLNSHSQDRAYRSFDGRGREDIPVDVLNSALAKPIARRLRQYIRAARQYEDPIKQALALSVVPLEELEEKAAVQIFTKKGISLPSEDLMRDALLEALLHWFKGWFKWVNAPCCSFCAGPTRIIGHSTGNEEELKHGGERVEVYGCGLCQTVTRFVRYNDPAKLLETRCGRCGEWANAFTLICRALGYNARWVVDWMDHVWTECFSNHLGRWAHCDPCEEVFDRPLLYEKGWGKQLSYVFGFGGDGCVDVIKRYTRAWSEVSRRRCEISELELEVLLRHLRREVRNGLSAAEQERLRIADEQEKEEMESSYSGRSESLPDEEQVLPGRQSGSEEWRVARGETNSKDAAVRTRKKSSAMAARDHIVGIVFNRLGQIVKNLIAKQYRHDDAAASKTDSETDRGVKDSPNDVSYLKEGSGILLGKLQAVVSLFEELLKDMGRQPYKSRSVHLCASRLEVAPGLLDLFADLGVTLQSASDCDPKDVILKVDGSLDIGPAIRLAVAVPVIATAIERLRRSLSSGQFEGQRAPAGDEVARALEGTKWLLQGERICGGMVVVSGENGPSEIGVKAFDGLLSTKWLDFGGKDGSSWILYCAAGGQPRKLVAYELTSAEDCPERDPRDWVLEGSQDGGSSWHCLDERKNVLFSGRNTAKLFEVHTDSQMASSTYRLRFTAVRDPSSANSLQICCIDLFAAPDGKEIA